jgi:hypothetical protein
MYPAKRRVSLLLASLLILTIVPLSAYAASPQETIRFWDNTTSVNMSLTFNAGCASCTLRIIGNTGTSEITATLYLQQKNTDGTYSTVKTWSGLSANGRILTASGTYAVTSGKTYRLKCDAVVTKSGVDEDISVYSEGRTA